MRMRTGEVLEGGPFAKKAATADVASFSSEHAFHMMLQTCTACHATFRLKRQGLGKTEVELAPGDTESEQISVRNVMDS
ncbi:MAG: cytochrome C-like protein [Rhizobium sp.]|nr:cytochrome C-like protein [Rhizobium sp.]